MKEEEWKTIPNYDGIYQISNYGRVKRLKSYDSRGHLRNERIRKPRKTKDGYLQIGLHKEGIETKFLLHKLVAQSFIKNVKKYNEVNHKDEDKTNNCVDNLEWCCHKYNANYGTSQERRLKNFSEAIKKRGDKKYA